MVKKETNEKEVKSEVKIEKLPNSEVKLTVVVPREEFDKSMEEVISKYSSELKVDGFRSGKIPKDVVSRTVGADKILYEGAEEVIRRHYINAILDNKIEAIGEPKVQITKIAKGNDLEFTAIVGVLPKAKIGDWTGAVKKINEKFKKEEIKVEEKEIIREIDFLAKQRAKIATVNRAAKKDDQVEIDFVVLKDNVPIENGTAKNHRMIIGEGKFIPGFEEKLVGMKAGDSEKFELKFPKEYHAKHLADQAATFEVEMKLVQERQIPEINDEFASGIGKFKTLEELKKNIQEGIEHEKKHQREEAQRKEIIDSVVEKTELDIPDVLINREIEIMISELDADIARIGLTKEQYFSQVKITEEKLKEQWRKDQAPKRVKAALAIRDISQENKIISDSKEIEDEVNKTMQYYESMGQKTAENIDVQRLFEATKANLTNEKVFQYLMKV